ncbi:orf 33 [Ateline gammaherpesvirus 3]|uniref:Orf 33 n=1 Tax=Ateline herpesvirus 3 TaxID=85618 RepID=Q9YTN3_ATHV3|nr:orf 33 [Ateline gammaherpesvirus 3]AAC95559.1 orf 33 [Ateline gammaherpesvirus 3]
MDDLRTNLRTFLNNECLWIKNKASTPFTKVFCATTAVSPFFTPVSPHGTLDKHYINVTLIILKPKKTHPYLTVYINEIAVDCCSTEVLQVKPVPCSPFSLIYFGQLIDPPHNVQIPTNISIKEPKQCHLSKGQVIFTSKVINPSSLPNGYENVIRIGACAWYANGAIFQHFLSTDYMSLCPAFKEFPSLSRILSLLTRCDDQSCVPCYGEKIHVNCQSGYTDSNCDGKSNSCPCIISCSALKSKNVSITGNRNLLSLLFDATLQSSIVSLKFFSPKAPTVVNKVFCGVLETGEMVECTCEAWNLIMFSDFVTRQIICNCQIMKRCCLRSC